MKDFMLIFLNADYSDLGLSPEEIQNRMQKWFEWHEKMEKQGIVKHGEALEAPVSRISGPDKIVTDNVVLSAKELIGGYYVVQAKDLNAAKEIAQDFPDYDLGGTVEIREVMVFENY